MTPALKPGDRVRFAEGQPRNHAERSVARMVGFIPAGRVLSTGTVPNGPKAGVAICDVVFDTTSPLVTMHARAIDQCLFERAEAGA